jgi:hypothetical protein
MSEDIVQEIWDKGGSREKELSVQEIEQALRPDVRRQSFAFRMYIWIWLVILIGTFILDALNIFGYSGNPAMLTTQIGLMLLGVIFGIYGIHLLREIRIMDRADESVTALLQRRLRFYRTKFEIWNVMMAGGIVLLSFAVNSYVDNENGYYRIGRVEAFVVFSIMQFAFMYGINKIAQYPIRKEIKIFLSDLEAHMMEGTQTLVVFRKRWRIWVVVFFIVGTILLLFGIWRAMQFGS